MRATSSIARWWGIAWCLALLALGAGAWSSALAAQEAARCVRPDTALARHGEALFASRGCIGCHTIGDGRRVGPDLAGVTARRDSGWVRRFIATPGALLDADPVAQALLAEANGIRMPDLRLADAEVTALVHYLAEESRRRGAAICSGT